ncbi:hypothetical protein V9T40_012378 [Parthenolecanium corni]|uniref:Peroxidase n=1 Tax=Parthenolecanium corni TaxID=536013 RepID=A0AAN9XZ99_9HEMI
MKIHWCLLILIDACCDKDGKPVDPMPYECLPTIMPKDDEFYSKFGVTCVDFQRSTNTRCVGCSLKPIRQINHQTAFLDLSILYGSSKERAVATRAFWGGFLQRENNRDNSFQEYPARNSGAKNCPYGGLGDYRISLNPEIFSMNTVFFRFHNHMARQLKKINRHWNDKLLYLYARRICVAMYQNVFFSEYIHTLIGVDAALNYNLYTLESGYDDGYNENISPQTFHEYTTTAGRSGHSMVRGSFQYGEKFERPQTYRLRDVYFQLDFFLKKNVFFDIIHTYAFEQCNKQDKFHSEDMDSFAFPVPEMTYGGDLSALGIDRGREFGLQSYNSYRKLCRIPELTSFDDLANDIVNPEDVEKLKSLYKSVEDIDLYVAGFMEKPYPGSTVGPTFTCLLGAQFQHWKFGDRKYFEFPTAKFTENQLKVIRETTFAQIICIANPGMELIPKNAFHIESDWNPKVRCDDIIQQIDLTPWKDEYK